jgi:hypothetical protein
MLLLLLLLLLLLPPPRWPWQWRLQCGGGSGSRAGEGAGRAAPWAHCAPVCTPMGSTFSIEQMMTQLSPMSRITSSSNSFQPMSDISTSTWLVMDASMPDCRGVGSEGGSV